MNGIGCDFHNLNYHQPGGKPRYPFPLCDRGDSIPEPGSKDVEVRGGTMVENMFMVWESQLNFIKE
jgi:hypothetical protein